MVAVEEPFGSWIYSLSFTRFDLVAKLGFEESASSLRVYEAFKSLVRTAAAIEVY